MFQHFFLNFFLGVWILNETEQCPVQSTGSSSRTSKKQFLNIMQELLVLIKRKMEITNPQLFLKKFITYCTCTEIEFDLNFMPEMPVAQSKNKTTVRIIQLG